MNIYVRVGCHDLFFWRKICALLKFKVTYGSGQSQVAIDSAEVNESTRGYNSLLLS